MRLSVSTPYRENSVVNIAKVATDGLVLHNFYTTLYLANWQPLARQIPLAGAWLADEFNRRAFAGIPHDKVSNIASMAELIHVMGRRLLYQINPKTIENMMYLVKEKFDIGVAKRLKKDGADVLVGMYAASLESFKILHQQDGFAVLNFVNSHPFEQNRYLSELAGLDAQHHEMIPQWIAARVEEELALADLVLVPSRFVAEQLRLHGVIPEKIATLPYGVDLGAFYPSSLREGCSGSEPLVCLYVGQISHRKGIRTLLDAARRCRGLPLCFRLIGPIVSAEVLDGLPDNVSYEGPSHPGGIAVAMRQADLFVLPTLEDSFALVLFEAMATALPVVTTTHAGASELIEDGRDGLIIPPSDAAALAEAIHHLVEEPELRARLGDAARIKVQAAHSWKLYGQSVLKTIERQLAAGERNVTQFHTQ